MGAAASDGGVEIDEGGAAGASPRDPEVGGERGEGEFTVAGEGEGPLSTGVFDAGGAASGDCVGEEEETFGGVADGDFDGEAAGEDAGD